MENYNLAEMDNSFYLLGQRGNGPWCGQFINFEHGNTNIFRLE